MISTRSVGLLIDTVVCLTLAKWETVSGRFGGYFTNTFLSLGQNRSSGGDLSIAVDPNDAEHVVLAYTNAPGANIPSALYLGFITESFDGGQTWTPKFATSATLKADQLAIDITDNGTIGFLYDSYDVNTNRLSQHFLTTANDFATVTDMVLATETNSSPNVINQ